jgi:predicted TIM-barrel fold metal-dependent hydrolase
VTESVHGPLVSADSHVVEPPDLWIQNIDPAFRDHGPRIVREEGWDRWYVADGHAAGSYGVLVDAGKRFDDPSAITYDTTFDCVPAGGFQPDAHVADMDADGVAINVLYPSVGLRLYRIPQSELLSAICAGYNRWITDFCAAHPDRLKGIAMLNLDDVETATSELVSSREAGLVGAMVAVHPGTRPMYSEPVYGPFFDTASDLDVPLSMHVATNRPGAGTITSDTQASIDAAARVNEDHWVRMTLASMIFGGVFERHPRLRIAVVEHEIAWIPHFLQQMDFVYRERLQIVPVRFSNGKRPSDVFREHVWVTFQEDVAGLRMRDEVGSKSLMWGSDYPHAESTWPRSREILGTLLADVPQAERLAIVAHNTLDLYGLELPNEFLEDVAEESVV